MAGSAFALAAITGSTSVESTLLILKVAFLILLYVFIWRIVRTAVRDIRAPQESMILAPHQVAGLMQGARSAPDPVAPRLVVVSSSILGAGQRIDVGYDGLTVGRVEENSVILAGDEYASTRHARFERRGDQVFVDDTGSTNGTFINGIRIGREQALQPGDLVKIGETELRYES